MTDTKIALRYAKAVLNLSLEKKMAEKVNDDMLLITKTISQSKELKRLLTSPVIKAKAKHNALEKIFSKKINPISVGLIDQLIDNKRLPFLLDVAKQYTIIYNHHIGSQKAMVTTAVPLNDKLKAKVLAKVKEIVGKEVTVENIVNPEILGGFILRVGDKQYDTSFTGKLNQLRREFDDNLYIPNF
ncbi:MAG: ATP synthase F1 subunit delta [Flavobacteriales bacterium]|nr:MAG: ATP synthase F1 subunit delta [Flavobacteriales bacterium]PIE49638.1 MAG: ATP synthase F1 subunit delta [Flavobacteriales bacterium]